MNELPRRIDLNEWSGRYHELKAQGLQEPWYGGPLARHVADGDLRLGKLRFDNSAAALRLWNMLLTENERLHQACAAGKKLIGTMKDLGTVPVMAYALDNVVAFYPDGAWWIPCVMECSTADLGIADALGIDESFCPVRAMLGAFVSGEHFPHPDRLICSVGAVCDDFSAIAQRLVHLGHEICWWEMPHRRRPEAGEEAVILPGGFMAPRAQADFVRAQLQMVKRVLEETAGIELTDVLLSESIRFTNQIRNVLRELRVLAYRADPCPMPALEMLIAEMFAIHFCSDRTEALSVLSALLEEVKRRVTAQLGVLDKGAVRIFWINPVADLRIMNLLEDCGGRICGSDYLFAHALDEIPEDLPPLEALAEMALADPMVGPASDRAARICHDIGAFGAEGVIISRIPGASHCALEGTIIAEIIQEQLGVPVLEIEVPPVSDAMRPSLRTRFEALVETIRGRRK
jgi:benzoyl-CoA reductase/2-hydroxyglutaryl-CoA dehydratase subunit BcrC/BadD/HgdB